MSSRLYFAAVVVVLVLFGMGGSAGTQQMPVVCPVAMPSVGDKCALCEDLKVREADALLLRESYVLLAHDYVECAKRAFFCLELAERWKEAWKACHE
jgi:hypothetical protein